MKKYFKQLPNFLIVVISLTVFVAFGIIYIWAVIPSYYIAIPTQSFPLSDNLAAIPSGQDPFVTKVPSLRDILTGPYISAADPSLGNERAKITIVEFADFVCAFCHKQGRVIRDIMEKYHNEVRFVWKDYPEPDEHSLSYQAALAARCAFLQDKFWPYHDRLFERAGNFSENDLFDLARESGLDLKEFDNCRSGELARQLIADNIEEAHALDITGVPFIYVNDLEFMGEITFDELERIIKFERER